MAPTVVTVAARPVGISAFSRVSFPGIPQSAACARHYIRTVLAGHPSIDTAILLVSELVTNAIRYSRSARPGGRVGVTLAEHDERIRIEVVDEGPEDGMPHLVDAGPDAQCGRGLGIVQAESTWGVENRSGRTVVWFAL